MRSQRQHPDDGRTYLPPELRRLEERIVLDAAAAATDHPHDSGDAHVSGPAGVLGPDVGGHAEASTDPAAHVSIWQPVRDAFRRAFGDGLHNPARLVAISTGIEDAGTLRDAAAPTTDALVFDEQITLTELLAQLTAQAGSQPLDSLALATHGLGPGHLALVAGQELDLAALHNPELQDFWRGVAALVAPGGRIDLLACDAGAGAAGRELLTALERLTGVDFAASSDATGAAARGGDWLLESDGVHAGAVYFKPSALTHFDAILAGPTITDTDANPSATGNEGPVIIDPGITVNDGGGGPLRGAAVRIGLNFVAAEDRLDYDHDLAASHGISGTYDTDRGQLLFAGDASAAAYQEVLRSVTYENLSDTPDTSPRNLIFVIGDDYGAYKYLPETGHYYRVVVATTNWGQASTNANLEVLGGLRGYLATVTGLPENNLLRSLVPALNKAWLGGSDSGAEGAWYWMSGPDAGVQFWAGGVAPGGTPVGGMFSNWLATQPDDTGNADSLALDNLGNWSDEPSATNLRYLVEYGGRSNDIQGQHVGRVMVSVVTPNHAPILDNTADFLLTPINEDAVGNAGTRVADLLASAGGDRISDFNGDAEGIAVTDLDLSHGTWQYSLDNGTTWQTISGVADNHALLLRESDLLRFQPAANWNGALGAAVEFRAWDQSTGTAGDYANSGAAGGHSAFSVASANATLSVAPVNDAPTLGATGVLYLAPMAEDDLLGQGTAVSALLNAAASGNLADVDGDPLGIVVVGLNVAHGTWQYSLDDGATWLDIDSISPTHALLLGGADRLRFVPDADWHGELNGAVSFRLWDQTAGHAGDFVGVGAGGAEAPFSAGTGSSRLVVQAVNDAPVVSAPLANQFGTDKSVFLFEVPLGAFADVDLGDHLFYTATLADGSALPTWLAFDPLTRRFTGTPPFEAVGTLALRVVATDGFGAIAADDFTLTIEHVNSAPTLAQPVAAQELQSGTAFSFQIPAGAFVDVDPPDVLSYAAALANGQPLPAWLLFDPLTRTFSGTPPTGATGTLNVRLIAEDGAGGIAATVLTLNISGAVIPPPEPPVPPPAGGGDRPSRPDQPDPPRTEGGTRGGLPDSGPAEPRPPTPGGGRDTTPGSSGAGGLPKPDGSTNPEPRPSGLDPSDAGSPADAGAPDSGAGPGGGAPASGAQGPGGMAVAPGSGSGAAPAGHAREEQVALVPPPAAGAWEPSRLAEQLQSAVFDSSLLTDASVPVEFRETWSLILGAYTQSGEELAVYLESAFRTVSEAACIYRAAEQTLAAAQEALAGTDMALAPDDFLAGILVARAEVRTASERLEAAIAAAALAGREGRFDQVLEDVISAALARLMSANQGLFVEAQALAAITHALRAGEVSDASKLVPISAAARVAAEAEIAEMRKSWDRLAQDVFSAFIARLAAQQTG